MDAVQEEGNRIMEDFVSKFDKGRHINLSGTLCRYLQ